MRENTVFITLKLQSQNKQNNVQKHTRHRKTLMFDNCGAKGGVHNSRVMVYCILTDTSSRVISRPFGVGATRVSHMSATFWCTRTSLDF